MNASRLQTAADDAFQFRQNFGQVAFVPAGIGEVREQLFGSAPLPECDVLVVDPPRAGLQEIGCAAVIAAKPPRVLLVSCSLESLARDLALLHEHYRTVAVRLCDLFPHTEHVEAVTLLERR